MDTNGLFNLTLTDGGGSELIANSTLRGVVSSNDTLYLGLTVRGNAEILPRQQLLSVPYAMMAGDVKKSSGNFTVNGTLTVTNNATIATSLQAASVQIGNTPSVTLSLTNSSLHVSQGLEVGGNLTVKGNITLMSGLQTLPTTTFINRATPGDVITIMNSAPCDGFIILCNNFKFATMTSNPHNGNQCAYYSITAFPSCQPPAAPIPCPRRPS